MVDLTSGTEQSELRPICGGLGVCEAADTIFMLTSKILSSGTHSSVNSYITYIVVIFFFE